MVAHLADHLIRAALEVVIEYDADLLAREKVHKAGQMAKIEAIFQKARDAGFRADQIAFGMGRHRAAPEKHAIVRIGAIDRVAQLDDKPGFGKPLRNAPRSVRMGEIVRSEEHTSELKCLMRISYDGF